jgi:hypothetical protein
LFFTQAIIFLLAGLHQNMHAPDFFNRFFLEINPAGCHSLFIQLQDCKIRGGKRSRNSIENSTAIPAGMSLHYF